MGPGATQVGLSRLTTGSDTDANPRQAGKPDQRLEGMTDAETRYYITTAIDYPNSRPHIGTAFEKIGADVQARFRRMEGAAVHFLMGNDENTDQGAPARRELGVEPKAYVDDMARQFQEVWRALDISFDDFIQTSEERHHVGCRSSSRRSTTPATSTRASTPGITAPAARRSRPRRKWRRAAASARTIPTRR